MACCESLLTLMATSPSFRANNCCYLYDNYNNTIDLMIQMNMENAFRTISSCCPRATSF